MKQLLISLAVLFFFASICEAQEAEQPQQTDKTRGSEVSSEEEIQQLNDTLEQVPEQETEQQTREESHKKKREDKDHSNGMGFIFWIFIIWWFFFRDDPEKRRRR